VSFETGSILMKENKPNVSELKKVKVKEELPDQPSSLKTDEGSVNVIKKSPKKRFISGLLLVSLLNLILLISTIFLLVDLPKKAQDLKKIRNEKLDAMVSSKAETSDLELKSVVEKVDQIKAIFPNESGLVSFVKEIENLKTGGVVKGITFVSQEAVRDKTTSVGIPFIVEMEGKWEQIDSNLQSIQKLNFLQRPVNITINVIASGLVNFKYGGFIYVDESLAKSR
jgi:hypothetical protein